MADPQDVINSMEYKATIEIPLPSGAFVRAEPLENNQARVLEVISTDPMDYMYEQYQPGNIVSLSK
jgi:hypothetical protein